MLGWLNWHSILVAAIGAHALIHAVWRPIECAIVTRGLPLAAALLGLVACGPAVETVDHRPVFLPNGDQIVFMRQDASTGGDWELFRANLDGSALARLTSHPGWDGYAVVAPDGRRLVFDRDDGEQTPKQPMVLDLATGTARPLGGFEGRLAINAWSPDGGTLYAFWERDGQRDLYAVTPEGEIVERITDTPAVSEHDAVISSDGRTLFFATARADGGSTGIDRLDLETRIRTTIATSAGRIYGLAISPDGRSLAFTDNPAGGDDDAELFLLDLATGNLRQLTDNGDYDHMPVFHPGGGYLLFTSYRSGPERIHRLDLADGAASSLRLR